MITYMAQMIGKGDVYHNKEEDLVSSGGKRRIDIGTLLLFYN